MTSKTWFALCGVIALAVAVWLVRRPSSAPVAARTGATTATSPGESPPAKPQTGFAGAITHPDAKNPMPWKKMAFKTDNDVITINLVTEPLGVCFPADMDAMIMEAKNSQKDLLLSLEPITGMDVPFSPQTRPLKLTDLQSGFRHAFHIPNSKVYAQLGLYVCADTAGSGSCAGKEPADLNRMLATAPYKKEKPGEAVPVADRIYYFEYIFQDPEGGLSTFENSPVPIQALEFLGTKFEQYFPPTQLGKEKAALEESKMLTRTIFSTPLKQNDKGELVMTIPQKDTKMVCSDNPPKFGDKPPPDKGS